MCSTITFNERRFHIGLSTVRDIHNEFISSYGSLVQQLKTKCSPLSHTHRQSRSHTYSPNQLFVMRIRRVSVRLYVLVCRICKLQTCQVSLMFMSPRAWTPFTHAIDCIPVHIFMTSSPNQLSTYFWQFGKKHLIDPGLQIGHLLGSEIAACTSKQRWWQGCTATTDI